MIEYPRVEFQMKIIDGSRLGRLNIPLQKTADWINFLLQPTQEAIILSAQQGDGCLILYFQASERLYAYLEGRLNCQTRVIHPENTMIGSALKEKLQVN